MIVIGSEQLIGGSHFVGQFGHVYPLVAKVVIHDFIEITAIYKHSRNSHIALLKNEGPFSFWKIAPLNISPTIPEGTVGFIIRSLYIMFYKSLSRLLNQTGSDKP